MDTALCSLREIVEAGFGKKQREWNSREILVGWRKRRAALANQYLLEAGQRELIDARGAPSLDERSTCGPRGRPVGEPRMRRSHGEMGSG